MLGKKNNKEEKTKAEQTKAEQAAEMMQSQTAGGQTDQAAAGQTVHTDQQSQQAQAQAAQDAAHSWEPNNEPKVKKKKGRKRRRKFIAIICVVVLAAGAMAVKAAMGDPVTAYPVAAYQAEIMDLEQIVSIKGTVEGAGSAEVASSENKEITAIYVKEGDQVKQGQILATLKPEDNTDYQEPYEKERAVRNMEAAQHDYEVALDLYEEGVIPYQDVLNAETTYQNSVTTVNSFSAPKKSDKNTIESPIDGTITRVNAKVGLVANDTQNMGSLFVIEDLSSLKMDVQVSEYNIRYIRVGQTVEISAEVLGKELAYGVVSYIAPTGEYKDGTNKEMIIPVTIDITEAPYGLIAGVSAKASILIDSAERVVTIPIDAIIADPETGENIVYLIKDGKLEKSLVKTGLESDFYIEVLSGVTVDDIFVPNPSFELYDGMEVMVLE